MQNSNDIDKLLQDTYQSYSVESCAKTWEYLKSKLFKHYFFRFSVARLNIYYSAVALGSAIAVGAYFNDQAELIAAQPQVEQQVVLETTENVVLTQEENHEFQETSAESENKPATVELFSEQPNSNKSEIALPETETTDVRIIDDEPGKQREAINKYTSEATVSKKEKVNDVSDSLLVADKQREDSIKKPKVVTMKVVRDKPPVVIQDTVRVVKKVKRRKARR